MSSLGNLVQIGLSALRGQQAGLNVVANNIANVNTEGYSRKSADLVTSPQIVGNIGTGVDFAGLTRARDVILDRQARFEAGLGGRLEFFESAMSTMEAIFTEVAGGGTTETGSIFDIDAGAALTGAFSRFFMAFQDLANNPESQATRAAVREEATLLTDQFRRISTQLSVLGNDLDQELGMTATRINDLTKQIAVLNKGIVSVKKSPQDVAGDLDDERDRLVDELATLLDVTLNEQTDGTFTITGSSGDGVLLVDRDRSFDLETRLIMQSGSASTQVVQAHDGRVVHFKTGKLSAILEARDEKLSKFSSELDTLASTFATRFNAQHSSGFGLDRSSGNFFFEPSSTSAAKIEVASGVLDNLDKIAASSASQANPNQSAGPGDGGNALLLSDVRLEKLYGGGTQTVEEFYADLVGELGAEARDIFTAADSQRIVQAQVDMRRENLRGVSINEEASQLILFQRAYQAAARIVTVVDDMMQAVINM